jgi:hypothetical protein
MTLKAKNTNPKTLPLEDIESKALASYLDDLVAYKKIKCFSHIPNETSIKHPGYLAKMKSMGKRRGIPDFIIICYKKILFVEMKRQKNEAGVSASVVSDDQVMWVDNINSLGKLNNNLVEARICYGSAEAIKFINQNI